MQREQLPKMPQLNEEERKILIESLIKYCYEAPTQFAPLFKKHNIEVSHKRKEITLPKSLVDAYFAWRPDELHSQPMLFKEFLEAHDPFPFQDVPVIDAGTF